MRLGGRDHFVELVGKIGGVMRPCEPPAMIENERPGPRRPLEGDNGEPCRGGLDGRVGERILARGQRVGGSPGVVGERIRLEVDEDEAVRDAAAFEQDLDAVGKGPRLDLADDNEHGVRLGRQQRAGSLDQQVKPLALLLKANVEDNPGARGQIVAGGNLPIGLIGPVTIGIDAQQARLAHQYPALGYGAEGAESLLHELRRKHHDVGKQRNGEGIALLVPSTG